jgi:hypothetical protein
VVVVVVGDQRELDLLEGAASIAPEPAAIIAIALTVPPVKAAITVVLIVLKTLP